MASNWLCFAFSITAETTENAEKGGLVYDLLATKGNEKTAIVNKSDRINTDELGFLFATKNNNADI
jgi:hypothetical protein